jgi:Ca2+-binding EF-hand superfamily protein
MPLQRQTSRAKMKKNAELVKLISTVSVKNIPLEDAITLMTAFKILDTENSGFLDKESIVIFFRAMGWVWSDEQMESAMLTSIGGGKRESISHLFEKKHKWSAQEVLRMADTFHHDRFSVDRDKKDCVDTFLTFADDDKDGNHMMRADLQKILAGGEISKMNMMLEFLGYDQKTLTFELDEIGGRMADLLDEPSRPEFIDLLTI